MISPSWKIVKRQRVIHFRCVTRLSSVYGQDQRHFIFRLFVFFITTLGGTLKGMLTPSSVDSRLVFDSSSFVLFIFFHLFGLSYDFHHNSRADLRAIR